MKNNKKDILGEVLAFEETADQFTAKERKEIRKLFYEAIDKTLRNITKKIDGLNSF